MKTYDEIFAQLKTWLVDLFEIDENKITPEAHLYDDLDIDSIDAVDLVVEIRKITGKQISPDDFKNVRTVDDVVKAIEKMLAA